jgi:outer membrane lipoprotein-sorting protein
MSVILQFEAALKIRLIFALVFFASCLPCFCQQNRLVDRIRQNYSGATTLSSTVDIRIVWKMREKTDNMRGSIMLAPGDRYRVDLGNTLWVSDGATLWQYDKALSQVVVTSLSGNNNSMLPSKVITSYCSKYPLKASGSTSGNDVLEWKADTTAGANGGDVSFVSITADRKTAAVKKLFVIDKSGNESTYSFSRTALGRSAPAGTFEFVPPKGARVLDQR